jgi:hypothetical protein
VGAGEGLAVFVNFVSFGREIVKLPDWEIIDSVRRLWCDAHTQLDPMSESAAQCVSDLGPQVTFNFVLHKAAGDRQQSETFDNGEWLNQV